MVEEMVTVVAVVVVVVVVVQEYSCADETAREWEATCR